MGVLGRRSEPAYEKAISYHPLLQGHGLTLEEAQIQCADELEETELAREEHEAAEAELEEAREKLEAERAMWGDPINIMEEIDDCITDSLFDIPICALELWTLPAKAEAAEKKQEEAIKAAEQAVAEAEAAEQRALERLNNAGMDSFKCILHFTSRP
jgi:hypothetical protein